MTEGKQHEIIKSHCNKCGPESNHKVLSKAENPWTDSVWVSGNECHIDGGNDYFVLKCAGCEEVSMRKDSWCSESQDYESGLYDIVSQYYPPRIFRSRPQWMSDANFNVNCPAQIRELYNEACICMQNECLRSTAMAIRAVLEEIMIHSIKLDQGDFRSNLAAFKLLGHISDSQYSIIKVVIETGNASTHRGFKPNKDDLILCFDVVEQLAQIAFIHKNQAGELTQRIPPRKKDK